MNIKKSFDEIFLRIKSRNIKNYLSNMWLPFTIIIIFVFLDLFTKSMIESRFDEGESKVIIDNFLNFTYVLNDGAAFSSFSGKRIFFLITTSIASLILLFYIIYDSDRLTVLMKIALSLVLAGALGNFVDRVSIGEVRDFIHIIYFGKDLPLLGEDFAIFNIADSCVTIGSILLIIGVMIGYHKRVPKKAVPNSDKPEQTDTQN